MAGESRHFHTWVCPGVANVEVACNDGADGGPCVGTIRSFLTTSVSAGASYMIRAGGWNNYSGELVLHVGLTTLCSADFNNDGSVDFFDYLDFVDAFSQGC